MGIKLDLKENFRFVKGDALSLSLISFTPGNGPEMPSEVLIWLKQSRQTHEGWYDTTFYNKKAI